jgi:hypothetical protein
MNACSVRKPRSFAAVRTFVRNSSLGNARLRSIRRFLMVDSPSFSCGAFVAQSPKNRPHISHSLHRSCRSNHQPCGRIPLCSNTAHPMHYLPPNSTPHVPFCSEFPRNALVCTLQSSTALHCPRLHPSCLTPNFICLTHTTNANVNPKSLPPHVGTILLRASNHHGPPGVPPF